MTTKARVLPKQGADPSVDSFVKQQLAGAVNQQRRDANNFPWNDGKYIRDVVIPGSGNKVITHGLKRALQGYIILRFQNVGLVFESASNATTLTLNNAAATPCTVDLWVF